MSDQKTDALFDELREYLKRQSQANERVSALLQQEIPAMKLSLARVTGDIERWRHTMDGNGHDGLVTRFALLDRALGEVKTEIARMREEHEQRRERRWQVYLALLGAATALAVALFEVVAG